MQARTVSAPAKINVILEVLGRRADGYHDLWSVLVLVDLCDTVTVAPRKRGILLTVRPPVVPTGPGNLAFRAAEAFFETWGRPGSGFPPSCASSASTPSTSLGVRSRRWR